MMQIQPTGIIIPTNVPLEFEKIVNDFNISGSIEIMLKPSQSFAKSKALNMLDQAFKKNVNIFCPSYEQELSVSRISMRQHDIHSDIDINPFYSTFFSNGNDLGVSYLMTLIYMLCSNFVIFKAESIGGLMSFMESDITFSLDQTINSFEIMSL